MRPLIITLIALGAAYGATPALGQSAKPATPTAVADEVRTLAPGGGLGTLVKGEATSGAGNLAAAVHELRENNGGTPNPPAGP